MQGMEKDQAIEVVEVTEPASSTVVGLRIVDTKWKAWEAM